VRTTITLDADTEALVKRRMRERNMTFKQAVNSALREALTGPGASAPGKYVMPAGRSMGEPLVTIDHALRVASDLEDEEIVRKLREGR
jgi:Arc/MetJ family transcription regulator